MKEKISLKKRFDKKPAKDQRERLLLLGLVELYLEMGKPIGSSTLQQNGFESLSSATIRNYFSKLEDAGFLKQQHSSGGRVPTAQAYKLYADTHLNASAIKDERLKKALAVETRQIAGYLVGAAETISEFTNCAVFLSAPRFDQDFILDIRLMGIDANRCLCVLVTDFGIIHTESLFTDKKLSNFSIKRIEAYLQSRLTGLAKPTLSPEEEVTGTKFYNEIMLRHIVNYAHFSQQDIYKTGFSKLLNYPDFNEASALANGLSIFENPETLRHLLKESCTKNGLNCWVGEEIGACSIIAIPYRINQSIAGAIAILGPNRMPYKELFGMMQAASHLMSEALTRSLYKFKISYRQPTNTCLLLEDKNLR